MTTTINAFITYDASSLTYSIQPGARTADIQDVLNKATEGSTLRFSEGTHTITKTMTVKTDNITITGAGEDKTTFLFKYEGTPGHGIQVEGTYTSWTGRLSADTTESRTSITLQNASGLKAGDILHIQQQNTTEFLMENGYENVVGTSNGEKNPINECVVEIASVSGNTVTLKTPITHDMDATYTTIKQVDPVYGASLSNFKIAYDLGTPDPDNFSNTKPAYDSNIAIYMSKTYEGEISNVSIINPPSNGVEFRTGLYAHVDGLYVDGAFNKGDGGNGYALQLAETYYGTFENLKLMNVRHSVAFASWHAEVGNEVHVLETNRDINYHGGADYNNTVIVESAVYRSGDTIWRLVSPGGSMHPYTDIDANTTLFGIAYGGGKYDVVHGWDSGAWLAGNGGKDTLYGGASHDVLIGGVEYDTLTGGGGRDIFAFRPGHGRDTLTDFKAGANGDYIVIDGFKDVNSFDDITLDGRSTGTRIIVNGEVIAELTGVSASSLTADNFMFNKPDVFDIPGHITPPVDPEPDPDDDTNNPPPPPTPVAGIDVNATSGTDKIIGSAKEDIVRTWMGQLNAGDSIALGDSYDTLYIQNTGLLFDSAVYTGLSGIDHIDLTSSTGNANLVIGKAFMDSTDDDSLTISYGSAGLQSLNTSALDSQNYEIHLKGSGTVTLSGGNDTVSVSSATGGSVLGGDGNDVFWINGGSAALNGGAGNDAFYFRTDSLTKTMAVQGGDGSDSLHFLQKATLDAQDVSQVSGIEKVAFSGTGNTLSLHNNLASSTLEVASHTGSATSVTIDLSTLTTAETLLIGSNVNVAFTGASSSTLTLQMADGAQGSLTGSQGQDKLFGNASNNTLSGGAGNDELTGGGGQDVFVVQAGGGQDRILDLTAQDKIDLRSYAQIGDKSALSMKQDGADILITLSAQDSLRVMNMKLADLTNAHFMFNAGAPTNPPEEPPPAGQVGISAQLSSAINTITGTAGNDTVKGYIGQFNTGDTLNLGAGYDTLILENTNLTFDSRIYKNVLGLDHIDLTATTGKARVILDKDFLDQTDSGKLTVSFDSEGLGNLDLSALTAGEYDVAWQDKSVTVSLKGSTEPEPEPETPVQGEIFTLSSKVETITGTDDDDIARGYSSQINTQDQVNLGDGFDTLEMRSSSSVFDSQSYLTYSGIDHIDLRAATGKNSLVLGKGFMAKTDDGVLTLSYGSNGIESLNTVDLHGSAYELVLKGSGLVKLSAGNDSVSVSSSTSGIIQGGGGNDTFLFRNDSLSQDLAIQGGDGSDTLRFTKTVNLNAQDVSKVTSIEAMEFSGTQNSVFLHNSMTGPSLTLAGYAGGAAVDINVSGLAVARTVVVGANINVSFTGASSSALTLQMAENAHGSLEGSQGQDTIIGNSLANFLSGNDGIDFLSGGGGADTLSGGAGADVFKYSSILDIGDIITDFTADDRLDLTALFEASGLDSMTREEAMENGHLKLTQQGNNVVVSFDKDGSVGQSAAVTLVTLQNTSGDSLMIDPPVLV